MIISKKKVHVAPLVWEDRFTIVDPTLSCTPLQIDWSALTKAKYVFLEVSGGGKNGIMAAEKIAKTDEVSKKEGRKNLFDYVTHFYGTSTGCLIDGLALSGVSSYDILDFYITKSPIAFEQKNIFGQIFSKSRYKNDKLDAYLKEYVGDITFKQMFEKTGKMFTVSAYSELEDETLFFNHETYPDAMVRRIMRASTAAPTYFMPEVYLGKVLRDGGTTGIYNCMLEKMMNYAQYVLKAKPEECYFISLGTSLPILDDTITPEAMKKAINKSKVSSIVQDVLMGGRKEATLKQVRELTYRKQREGWQGFRWDINVPTKIEAMDKTNFIDQMIFYLEHNASKEVYW